MQLHLQMCVSVCWHMQARDLYRLLTHAYAERKLARQWGPCTQIPHMIVGCVAVTGQVHEAPEKGNSRVTTITSAVAGAAAITTLAQISYKHRPHIRAHPHQKSWMAWSCE